MCVVTIMLIVAIGLTPVYFDANFDDEYPLAVPVICQMRRTQEFGNQSLERNLTVIGFIAYGYVVRMLKFFRSCDRCPRRLSLKLRTLSNQLQYGQEGVTPWNPYEQHCSWLRKLKIVIADPFLIVLYHFYQIHLYILTSFLGEVLEVLPLSCWSHSDYLNNRSSGS